MVAIILANLMGVNLHFSDDFIWTPFHVFIGRVHILLSFYSKSFPVFLFFGLFLYTGPLSNNMHCGEYTVDCLFTQVCFHEQKFLIHSKISLFMPIIFVTDLLPAPKSWKNFCLSHLDLKSIWNWYLCVYMVWHRGWDTFPAWKSSWDNEYSVLILLAQWRWQVFSSCTCIQSEVRS